jgi:urease accessory protein
MPIRIPGLFVLTAALTLAPLAQAHPLGAHHELWRAFVHPFGGIDHLLAMLVIGVWAGLAAPTRRLVPPLSFVVALIAGAALGTGGMALPAVEIGIALSLVLLGPLAARDARLPVQLCFVVCALAGLAHGYAHGVELAGQAGSAIGFVLGSCVLHALGFLLAQHAHLAGGSGALRSALSASSLIGVGLLYLT